jgi:RNA polymerase primary sigma factor
MKHNNESEDLQGLVSLGREQGYLTSDQANDSLPQDVASPGDLRTALESFESMNIKVLDEVPADGIEDAEAEPKEEPEEESVDDFSESSDPVRLYLKEMGRVQLLTREAEVAVAKRIKAGEREVEEEILKSPVMLDYVIRIGEQVEASDVDLREVFEETEEALADEERGPEADQAQHERLLSFTRKLTNCARNWRRRKKRCAPSLVRGADPTSTSNMRG